VDLRSTGDPDGVYRTVAVTVPQGTLVTSLSLNPTTDTLASLRRIELLASLAVLIAMSVIAMVVVRRGLRPLRHMAGTADAIASGDLTRRVPEERSGTEVGRLGVALNEMLAQIEGAFAEKSASEERLRQFVADASHELRTPLTSIRGYAELLGKGGFSDDASRRRALQRIEEEATRMGGLVEDLLLLAELDRGRPLRAEPVDLQRICADAVGDSNAVAHGHHLVLVEGGPVMVLGDDERLAQVAHNLVRNALAHTPPGTEVTVSTGVQAGMGYVKVSDNGPGIDTGEVQRVFDRFYQSDPSRAGAGTGLGLAIVQAIAQALGGTASVAPTAGGGATLTVAVPLASSHRPTAPTAPVRSPQLH
jgi:two-component system OmpR family sensor kinase